MKYLFDGEESVSDEEETEKEKTEDLEDSDQTEKSV